MRGSNVARPPRPFPQDVHRSAFQSQQRRRLSGHRAAGRAQPHPAGRQPPRAVRSHRSQVQGRADAVAKAQPPPRRCSDPLREARGGQQRHAWRKPRCAPRPAARRGRNRHRLQRRRVSELCFLLLSVSSYRRQRARLQCLQAKLPGTTSESLSGDGDWLKPAAVPRAAARSPVPLVLSAERLLLLQATCLYKRYKRLSPHRQLARMFRRDCLSPAGDSSYTYVPDD